MNKKMDLVKKHFGDNYFNDEIKNRISSGVNQQIGEEKLVYLHNNKINKSNKWIKMCGVAVAGFAILIGSSFLSPTMASVVVKIPFFEHLFHQQNGLKEIPDLFTIVEKELQKNGFERVAQNYKPNSKHLYVSLSVSKTEFKKVELDVKKIVEEAFKQNKIDGFKITVLQDEQGYQASIGNGVKSPFLETEKLFQKELEAKGFVVSYVSLENKEAYVAVPLSKKNDKEKLKEVVTSLLEQHKFSDYPVKIDEWNDIVTEDGRKENEWSKIMVALDVGISMGEKYKYNGIGRKYEPNVFTLFIETSLDKEQTDVAKELEVLVDDFIQKANMPEKTNNQTYKIVIKGKNGVIF